MSRTANPDIGKIACPFTGEISPVRRYRTGQRLAYYHSAAGKIAPNLPLGQKYILEHATFNDPEDKRQIERWLKSRGVQVLTDTNSATIPAIDPGRYESLTVELEPKPEMHETVIGGDTPADPLRDSVKIDVAPREPDPVPPTPARSRGFLDRFMEGDEE